MGCASSTQQNVLAVELDSAVQAYLARGAPAPSEKEKPHIGHIEVTEEDVVLDVLSSRPVRHGKWFTVHESYLNGEQH